MRSRMNDVACIAATIAVKSPHTERLLKTLFDTTYDSRFGRGLGTESVCAAQTILKPYIVKPT